MRDISEIDEEFQENFEREEDLLRSCLKNKKNKKEGAIKNFNKKLEILLKKRNKEISKYVNKNKQEILGLPEKRKKKKGEEFDFTLEGVGLREAFFLKLKRKFFYFLSFLKMRIRWFRYNFFSSSIGFFLKRIKYFFKSLFFSIRIHFLYNFGCVVNSFKKVFLKLFFVLKKIFNAVKSFFGIFKKIFFSKNKKTVEGDEKKEDIKEESEKRDN